MLHCSKCNNVKSFQDFDFKNKKDKIYYQHCNECREKTINNENYLIYKARAKEKYDIKKKANIIHCDCGAVFVAHRDYHIFRHVNSRRHKQ